ncbi:transcriptional regulator [Rapidithrix thailandica]|uniref:HTH-type transcriptional regulator n=1 Tax=Rapidithrix thailandica TaxID=413964 RepID=A0AAW9RVR5_9BACT
MNYSEAKAKFIQTWGSLGSHWGINRTMAQIHALLLVSRQALSTEDIMHELTISRGNTNMNVRALIDWGLVDKELRAGERREYFYAFKDVNVIARQIAQERKKRELDPLRKVLKQINEEVQGDSPGVKELKKVTSNVADFSDVTNQMLEVFVKSGGGNWLSNLLLKIMK